MRRALIVGAGGLGCPAALALAYAGVEHLTLVDPDTVDETNLHRQVLHLERDIGRPKVESAREKLVAQFPKLSCTGLRQRVDAAKVKALFENHSVVLDGTDDAATKFLLSDAAVATGTLLIYGGVLRFEGRAMAIRPGGPCLRCLFEDVPPNAATCAQAGVMGTMAGLTGALMAQLALEIIQSTPADRAEQSIHPKPLSVHRHPPVHPELVEGGAQLHILDGERLKFRTVTVKRAPDCRAHSSSGALSGASGDGATSSSLA